MVPFRYRKVCTCDGTCNCQFHHHETISTRSTYADNEIEEDKRQIEKKSLRLEKKAKLNAAQPWKHKNKPRF